MNQNKVVEKRAKEPAGGPISECEQRAVRQNLMQGVKDWGKGGGRRTEKGGKRRDLS